MGVIFHKNPTEESFIIWMDNFPESFHWCDMKRFIQFSKTIIKYNSEKWLEYNYFYKRIIQISPNFKEENILFFYEKLHDIILQDKIQAIPLVSLTEKNKIFRRARKGKIFDKLA